MFGKFFVHSSLGFFPTFFSAASWPMVFYVSLWMYYLSMTIPTMCSRKKSVNLRYASNFALPLVRNEKSRDQLAFEICLKYVENPMQINKINRNAVYTQVIVFVLFQQHFRRCHFSAFVYLQSCQNTQPFHSFIQIARQCGVVRRPIDGNMR